MASTFDTKFEVLLDRIPQSVMETPWKKTLFWIAYWSVAVVAILLFAIFGLLKGIFEESGKHSHSHIDQAENEQREKEYAEQELLWMMDEEHKRREPSVFNDY